MRGARAHGAVLANTQRGKMFEPEREVGDGVRVLGSKAGSKKQKKKSHINTVNKQPKTRR